MSRPKSTVPAYTFHVSGQAVVRLDHKDFYLGKHGTPESYARYHSLLAEYNANGLTMPENDDSDSEQLGETSILVKHVTADYRDQVLPRYENNNGSYVRMSNLLKLVEKYHADEEPETFGPRKLSELREKLVKTGNSRKYVNQQVRDIVRIMKHGVSRELVSPSVLVALSALEPLRPGQAKDNPKRDVVSLADVEKTIEELGDTVTAMVRIQLCTGMRPSELFRMTPAMIDRSGVEWIYRPAAHKTASHGITKAVPIVGSAREALAPFLFTDGLCFVNQLGNAWDKDSYRHSVERACKRAKVSRWTPYQLRSLAAQRVRDALGAEYTQALLGHSRLSTVEHYSQASEQRAVEAAKAIG